MIPIDRLTDVRAPVEAVARRVGRSQLERVYGLHLPLPKRDEDPHRCTPAPAPGPPTCIHHGVAWPSSQPTLTPPAVCRPPTALELLHTFGRARGWVAASGLPDETRAGRRILKDYVDGKLLYVKAPPGAPPAILALAAAAQQRGEDRPLAEYSSAAAPDPAAAAAAAGGQADVAGNSSWTHDSPSQASVDPSIAAQPGSMPAPPSSTANSAAPAHGIPPDEGDLLLIEDLDIGGKKAKQTRPAYKVRICPSHLVSDLG